MSEDFEYLNIQSDDKQVLKHLTEMGEHLKELKAKQKALGINSEWVFCKEDGTWTTTAAYYEALYKVTHKLGLKLSNNHAFRMALNSYVYVPMGLPVTERNTANSTTRRGRS